MLTITCAGQLVLVSMGMRAGPCVLCNSPRAALAADQKLLASLRNRPTAVQSMRRLAVHTMASNTGCTSVGDWLMTRKMSTLAD